MANKKIFVSFPKEDENLRDLLLGQAKNTNSPFDFTDMSVHKPWDNAWKTNCLTKIKGCDGLIAIVTLNTLQADGQLWEINCAADEEVPILCIKTSEYSPGERTKAKLGYRRIYNWDWNTIKKFIVGL